jgi:TraM recognition site of TraD and TraG
LEKLFCDSSLGQIIISKLQLAAMSRVDTPAAERRPFYLYLDEFQTFTGVAETSYEKILSRARKYKLGLVLAHQQTGQISQKLLKEIFGNVTTFISFSVSHDDATKLSNEYAIDVGAQVEYLDPGEFIRLKTGEAIGKIGKTVFPLRTILLPTEPHPEKVNFIINRSRKNYSNGAAWEVNTKNPTRPDRIQLPPPQKSPRDIDPQKVF